ncbi:MAG TPA: helix-turn-helix transcriptional regulator [Candidatus Acidoferrum sp.]|jgi:transcriptional regulator with XRE-family HTH domain|nr:helix-turn-helix transcriptional regulator [Candidatus Acidoferrum sp.]
MSTAKLRKVEETFSERLKMLRKERGWSQEDLATRMDVSAGSVGNWEMGPYEPHPKTLKKLAGLLEVEVSFLTRGEREEIPRAAMQEQSPEYRGVNLAGLLREVEDARDSLERIAQQLRRATAKSGAATLVEAAETSYDQKRGARARGGVGKPDERSA